MTRAMELEGLYSRGGLSCVQSGKSRFYCIDFSRPSPGRVNLGGDFTKTRALWRLGTAFYEYVAILRIALLPRPKARIANPQSADIARKRRSTAGPVTDRRASFTRRFRAVWVRHASIRGQI